MSKKTSRRELTLIFFVIAIFWSGVILAFALTANHLVKNNVTRLTLTEARSFFKTMIDVRYWNASHGGLYAPITPETTPNPYLKLPHRDVTTQFQQKLTLINPAYMTRQIGEITAEREGVRFHITSLRPIRPENKPLDWEEKALSEFKEQQDEYYDWHVSQEGKPVFRYMAPLWTEDVCLKCHDQQGYKLGDLRGGISVTIPAESILDERKKTLSRLNLTFAGIWFLSIILLFLSNRRTIRDFEEREELIVQLEKALDEVKTLQGIIPICASCKKIRTDSGSWEKLEKYISEHSEAEFSHGLCPDCMKKLYPDYDLNSNTEDSD